MNNKNPEDMTIEELLEATKEKLKEEGSQAHYKEIEKQLKEDPKYTRAMLERFLTAERPRKGIWNLVLYLD